MNLVEYLVQRLADADTRVAYGIPGGVILDLLYAMEHSGKVKPCLTYHEQGAALAACGYAQATGGLGVAYATRGPGFTNLLTGMAEAYQDGTAVLFVTAHATKGQHALRRAAQDQEMDTLALVRSVTKYASCVDDIAEAQQAVDEAIALALHGRRGPVFLDIRSSLWRMEIDKTATIPTQIALSDRQKLQALLNAAQRPILLLGDGIHAARQERAASRLIQSLAIPTLSSRYSADIAAGLSLYHGYIGSHGMRYSNYILAKADMIIALGNRMAYPLQSASFASMMQHKVILRFDTDEGELLRPIPGYVCQTELREAIEALQECHAPKVDNWRNYCHAVHKALSGQDTTAITHEITTILAAVPNDVPIVCDVGNQEFWVSSAYLEAEDKALQRIFYSKAFGTLGSALPRAVGVCMGQQKPVLAFVGDQGLQMNSQELQLLAQHQLPICVVVLNNHASGMIRCREQQVYAGEYLHTTGTSGYSCPSFQQLAAGYGITWRDSGTIDWCSLNRLDRPVVTELSVPEDMGITPTLPKGAPCTRMTPPLDETVYQQLEELEKRYGWK